jgi:hypothetical protein
MWLGEAEASGGLGGQGLRPVFEVPGAQDPSFGASCSVRNARRCYGSTCSLVRLGFAVKGARGPALDRRLKQVSTVAY